jgi:5'-nucleotidase/UDP-sugar diphosphatase
MFRDTIIAFRVFPMKTKKFTILHSNDMHGDFFSHDTAEKGKLIGGLALLSGYVKKVRAKEENVLYVIAGDMLQGSLIDTEYKGLSTIEIMNFLAPDVVSIGNHEVDYGLPHLLFLEKLANFPVVNANLYIKKYYKRLMNPFHIINKAGFEILFTGVITEKIIDSINTDSLIGSFITLEEASREIGKISNAYKNNDIDLTIVLSHIGFESDLELARLLDPEWGIDMIIGGHSHTILKEPAKVNNILIAQAGVGTDQIGRFDIIVDDDTNSIIEYKWQLIEIEEGLAEPDEELLSFLNTYKKKVDDKYRTVLCRLGAKLTHPNREIETTLGDLIADALAENAECDVMFCGSGAIRVQSMGPVVTLKDLITCFPYDDSIHRFTLNGAELKKIFSHVMRKENRNGEGENYQVNGGVEAVYDDKKKALAGLKVKGEYVKDEKIYTFATQGFHFKNCQEYLNISESELLASGQHKVVTTSAQQVLEEWLRRNSHAQRKIEGRLVYLK